MDAEEYRSQYEAEIADSAAPADDFDVALLTSLDKSAATGARLAAVQTVNQHAYGQHAAIDALLRIVGDDDEPADLRHVALDGLEVLRMASAELQERKPELTVALKKALTADDQRLQQRSVALLAAEHDTDVQQQLIDGLRDESTAIVSAQRSVELLGYDLKADAYDVLRDVARGHDDPETRREAVRLLAADADSKELIEEVVRNKDEHRAVRDTGAAALQAVAPGTFESVAQDIVADDSDHDDIKVSVLYRLTQQPSPATSDSFVAQVTKTRDELDESSPVQQAAQRYLDLREAEEPVDE